MPECHLRVRSDDDVVLNSIVLWCRSQAKVYIAVQEIGKSDGKHIHVILDTNLSISRFRQLLIEKFPILHGNRSYSCKNFKEDLEHNIRYCCKGTKETLPVTLFHSISLDEITKAHKKFWEIQEKYLTEHGVKVEDNPTKKKSTPFVEKVFDQLPCGVAAAYAGLQSIYHPSDYELSELEKVKDLIIDTVIKSLGKFSKTCDDHILTRLINGVFIKCVTDCGNKDDLQALKSRMKNRISQNLY